MQIEQVSPTRTDVFNLIRQSDEYFSGMYPAESNHLESADNLSKPNVILMGAYADMALVGIGAVKIVDGDITYGEIKRVFVTPEYRGQGISKLIIQELERRLIENQVVVSRLETGAEQSEAIGLYAGMGYGERPPFGDYNTDPLSVFMEKKLSS